MELRALRYFAETVRLQSFTRAAEVLCVTQSAVSKLVRQLEVDLGQPLLHRDARQLRLTDAGQLVYAHAQEALAVVARMDRALHDLSDLQQGELTLGLPPMVNIFFPKLIQSFRQRHPGLSVALHEAGGQVIEAQVMRGELEVGVTAQVPQPGQGLAHHVIERHPICLVGRPDSPWATQAQPDLHCLDGQPVLMLAEDYAVSRMLEQAFAAAGVAPQVVARSGQWDFLLSMALSGMGTALLPEPLLERQKLPVRAAYKALPPDGPTWDVALIWSTERYLSHAARAWLRHCGVRDLDTPTRP